MIYASRHWWVIGWVCSGNSNNRINVLVLVFGIGFMGISCTIYLSDSVYYIFAMGSGHELVKLEPQLLYESKLYKILQVND